MSPKAFMLNVMNFVFSEDEVDDINASIDHMIPSLNPSPSGAM